MRRLFFCDVHLSPRETARTERFLRFLAREGPRADEIYILGDLFDYWIGPKHLRMPDYRGALEALSRLARERPIFFLIGNRDFYMSRGFQEATGVRVVPGRTEHCLSSGGKRVYLCHGEYLEGRTDRGFRIQEFIRSAGFERVFVRLPVCVARAMAEFYRWLSTRKPVRECRPCPAIVEAKFRQGADVIISGHFHDAAQQALCVDGRQALFITLADWAEGESYLVEEGGRWELRGGG
ncbi:MAG: hypothetical protein FJ288_00735 [Planctomycetes bacterium]|nr:hypothetical protein [Planctomycetota bacterium]